MIRYISLVPHQIVTVPKIDGSGEPLYKLENNLTKTLLTEGIRFRPCGNVMRNGTVYQLSEYIVDASTPKHIADAIEKSWSLRHTPIYTEEEYIDMFCPELKRERIADKKYREAVKDRDAAAAEADLFKRKFAQLEAELAKEKKGK